MSDLIVYLVIFIISIGLGFILGLKIGSRIELEDCNHNNYSKWSYTAKGPVYYEQIRSCDTCGHTQVHKWRL